MKGIVCCLVLIGCFVNGCSLVPEPEQPASTQPYALLIFPETIRLLAFDGHNIDPRLRVRELRVTPGSHLLRWSYNAATAGGSLQHAGQENNPFPFETQAGFMYVFEAKT